MASTYVREVVPWEWSSRPGFLGIESFFLHQRGWLEYIAYHTVNRG